jgi:cytidylate kinase
MSTRQAKGNHVPAVTVSAGYGAGGSVVARALAERLSYPLLDRAISSQVAQRLKVSVPEAEGGAWKRTFPERFFGSLAAMSGAVVGSDDDDAAIATALIAGNDRVFRQSAEQIMRAALPQGVVILGRAGGAALHGLPGVLTVRLFGSTEARIAQAAAIERVDTDTARRRLPEVDKARAHYVRHLYATDIDDPSLFDLQIDSTLVPVDTCTAMIATAFTAFLSRSHVGS